jgi:FkbM family methyltransferase
MNIGKSVQSFARRCGLTIHRGASNRFDAMEESLRQLTRRGFVADTVIDVGANRGQWARLASQLFPAAHFHLIEPQSGCREALRSFSGPRFDVHNVAVTGPSTPVVRMVGGGGDQSSTGAFVPTSQIHGDDGVAYTATTLDELLMDRLRGDRVLLKLDIEGHEIDALSGAEHLLRKTEVIISEVHFYDVNRSGTPLLADLVAMLGTHGFDLYDIAALGGRPSDGRLRSGDVVFVSSRSQLAANVAYA